MFVMLIALLAMLLSQQPETMSLLEEPLYAPKLSKPARAAADAELARAHAEYVKAPSVTANILALERAHLALGRLGDALVILTHGIEVNSEEAALFLERGRGYILIRKFDAAERDLRKAADKLPEARCALGLAQYLSGDFPRARASYAACQEPGVFAYLAERRGGGTTSTRPAAEGPVPSAPPPIRLPGTVRKTQERAAEPIAATYLTAIERLLAGDRDAARDQLKNIVEKDRNDWMEPAYIAAEADYARLKEPERRKRKR